jgi:hypothetical protein
VGGGCGKARRRDAAGEVGKKKTAGEFEEDLNPNDGCVIPYPEEAEAESEEEGIAGEANQSRECLAGTDRERELPVLEDVSGDVAIDFGVAVGFKEVAKHPATEQETCQKSSEDGND